jgi:hypothetical protein
MEEADAQLSAWKRRTGMGRQFSPSTKSAVCVALQAHAPEKETLLSCWQ